MYMCCRHIWQGVQLKPAACRLIVLHNTEALASHIKSMQHSGGNYMRMVVVLEGCRQMLLHADGEIIQLQQNCILFPSSQDCVRWCARPPGSLFVMLTAIHTTQLFGQQVALRFSTAVTNLHSRIAHCSVSTRGQIPPCSIQ